MKYKLLANAFYQGNDFYNQLYESRISGESTYKFEFHIKGYNGFVVINHEILQRLDKILEINSALCLLTRDLPEVAIAQYARRCLIDEIYLTNDIEGIYSTRKEINDIMLDKKAPKKYKRFYGLVKKYETLLSDSTIKLSICEDIRVLYDDFVLSDVIKEDPENAPEGTIFRKDHVYITGNDGQPVHAGLHPEEEIIKCMSESLTMLNNGDYNFLIRIAVFHYMFGYIHPFYDGNGRMTRFISSYLLSKKLNFLVACRLSCAVKNKLAAYYKSFRIVNDEKNKGDLTSFVITFFDIIIDAEQELYEALVERKDKLNFYSEAIRKVSDDTKIAFIAFILVQNTLFGTMGLSVKEIQTISGIGENTVRNTLRLLEQLKLLNKGMEGRAHIYDIHLDNLAQLEG